MVEREWFPALAKFIRAQIYDRDGGHSHPRYRFEIVGVPDSQYDWWRSLRTPCVACGKPMHPVRARADGSLYLSVGCPLGTNIACSRGKAASAEYVRIKEYLDETRS